MRRASLLLVLGSACVALTACATARRATSRAGAEEPLHRVVVVSVPRGALIVFNGRDTLAHAPLVLPVRRGRRYESPNPLMFEALPADSGQCVQATMIDNDEATPDTVRFDMRRCPPANVDLGAVFDTAAVTDKPVRVWLPAARYPDGLRYRGIEGRVVVGFVIDTLGRAEPASVNLLEVSHPDFGPPTVEIVLNSVFWPGRISGRKVRVWVRVPINYTIARAG
jgi:TonB family protein